MDGGGRRHTRRHDSIMYSPLWCAALHVRSWRLRSQAGECSRSTEGRVRTPEDGW